MVTFANEQTPLFELGRVVSTPGAIQALENAGVDGRELLARHERGDWGNVGVEDRQTNNEALKDGSRLLSSYALPNGVKIWIVTEAVGDDGKRASTSFLTPDEY